MTMYLRCAYQRSSPDREPGNCAVECMENHWMMQYYPWYVLAPTVPQFMSNFCHWALNLPRLFLIACLCILPGASQLLFRQVYRYQEQSFSIFPCHCKSMSKLDVTNTTIVTPLWSRLLWSGLRILAVELDQMRTYLIPKN